MFLSELTYRYSSQDYGKLQKTYLVISYGYARNNIPLMDDHSMTNDFEGRLPVCQPYNNWEYNRDDLLWLKSSSNIPSNTNYNSVMNWIHVWS